MMLLYDNSNQVPLTDISLMIIFIVVGVGVEP